MSISQVYIISPPSLKVMEPKYDLPEFPRPALAYLKTFLQQKFKNLRVLAIDGKFERYSIAEILNNIQQDESTIVALTAFTAEIKAAAKLAEEIKKKFPHIKIVIGGVHASALPFQTMEEFSVFDFLIKGEGEYGLMELITAIDEAKDLKEVTGLFYRDLKTQKILASEQAFRAKSVFSELDDIDWSWTKRLPKEFRIMTQKGCPFTCDFCANPNGREVKKRSHQSVIKEIIYAHEKFGVTKFHFDDEVFGLDEKYTVELLRQINNLMIKDISLNFMAHARSIRPLFCQALYDFKGKIYIGLGMETGDEERLKEIGKSLTQNIIINACKNLKKGSHIFVEGLFIIGHPRETIKSALKTIFFAAKLNIDLAIFGIMVPYPGTKLWSDIQNGKSDYRFINTDWDEFNKQISKSIELKNIKRWQLELLQAFAYNYFFLSRLRVIRWGKFLLTYRYEIKSFFVNLARKA